MAMQRLKAQCHCCGQEVELYRDQISGPEHYRCGNCFEIFNLEDLEGLREMNVELEKLEEKRNAVLTTYRQHRS